MEMTIIIIGIVVVSSLASYGYYLTWKKEMDEFDKKRKSATSYRTNEEFVNYPPEKSAD